MAKTVQLELKKTEVELLYNLVQDYIDKGYYYGNKDWFVVMQANVSEKLEDAMSELENEP